jgi:hypothetical protein
VLVLAASEVTLTGASIDTADGKGRPIDAVFTGPASANHEVSTRPVRAAARGPHRSAPHPRWYGGARETGRLVTRVVRPPVKRATLWMRVVSRASARVIAGKIVVSRRASIDLPAPGGPRSRT